MDTPSPFPSTPVGRLNQIEALEEAQRRAPLSPVVTKYIHALFKHGETLFKNTIYFFCARALFIDLVDVCI